MTNNNQFTVFHAIAFQDPRMCPDLDLQGLHILMTFQISTYNPSLYVAACGICPIRTGLVDLEVWPTFQKLESCP